MGGREGGWIMRSLSLTQKREPKGKRTDNHTLPSMSLAIIQLSSSSYLKKDIHHFLVVIQSFGTRVQAQA